MATNLAIQTLIPKCQTRDHLLQLQAHFISTGLFRHPYLTSQILRLSSRLADINHTISVFQRIHSPDAYCINTLIRAHSSSSLPHLAPLFYFRMLRQGCFHPNSFTFPPLLASCANSLSTHAGFICHSHSIKYGVHDVLPVQNSLINMYACFGLIHSAKHLFDQMPDRDVVSWNSIIHGYVKVGNVGAAVSLFDEMPIRNVVSWNVMICGYLKEARNPGCGLKLFREMVNKGLKGSDTTFVSVVTACSRSARLKEGRSVHGSLVKNYVKSSLILDTALIDMYSKCQRVEVARRVFDKMLDRNLVCWNAMILGYCIQGNPECGLALFNEMVGIMDSDDDDDDVGGNNIERDGRSRRSVAVRQIILPDEITFVGVLCACARDGLLSDGMNYFNQMSSVYGIMPKFAHYWCMANLYYGVGLVENADEILRSMPEDEDGSSESSVWSTLLGSCRFRGEVELGKRIAMRLIELEPKNGSHYTLLLNIYAVAGRWEDTVKVKTMMEENGVEKACGYSLADLNEMVHEYKVAERLQPGMNEVYTMLNDLVQKLRVATGQFTNANAYSGR